MLVKKELLTIEAAAPTGAKSSSKAAFATLPRSGKVLYFDVYDDHGAYEGRVFCDAKNVVSVDEKGNWDDRLKMEFTKYWSSYRHYASNTTEEMRKFLGVKNRDYNILTAWSDAKRQKKLYDSYEQKEKRLDKYNKYLEIGPLLSKEDIRNLTRYSDTLFDMNYGFITGRKQQKCSCGKCHAEYTLSGTVKVGMKGICDNCGYPLEYVTENTWHKDRDNTETILYATRKRGAVLLGVMTVFRRVHKAETEYSFGWKKVNIYPNNSKENYLYCWSQGLYYGGYDWREQKNECVYDTKNTYTANLDKVFGADWHGVNVKEIYLEHMMKSHIPLDYLVNNAFHARAEYLIKSGFEAFAVENPYWLRKMMRVRKSEKTCFSNIFGMLPDMKNVYQKCKITPDEHHDVLAYFPKEYISAEQIARMRRIGLSELPEVYTKYGFSFKKILNYAEKQYDVTGCNGKTSIGYHKDYLELCKTLGVDVSHKSVKFPANVREAHNRLMRQQQEKLEIERMERMIKQTEKVREEYEKLKKKYDAACKRLAKLDGYTNGIYEIHLPRSYDEYITEGASLNICVATNGYYRKHAERECEIFFIRRCAEPERPFFCMELTPTGGIWQLRGYSNCAAPDDIKEFSLDFSTLYRKTFVKRTAIA